MEPRGRSRARGRARAGQPLTGPPGPRPGPPMAPGAVPPQQQAPGPQGPWARPAVPQQQAPQPQPPAHWVRPQMPTPAVSAGRGSRLGGGDAPEGAPVAEQVGGLHGAGEGALAQDRGRGGGNGGVRGRTIRHEIMHTRPPNFNKQGSSGTPIQLIANYFTLLQAGKWGLNQYRVDFNPDIDHTGRRKGMFRNLMQGVQGVTGYLFDGTVMYTPQRLNPDPLERVVETEAGEQVRITVRLVGDVAWGDHHYIQLFNIIIRKCLAFMQLQMVGRDYFDPNSKIAIPEYKLELWPGYYTSMRQHEQNILMNADVAFKVMRTDNVYDMLLECRSGNPRAEFQSKIIGSVVLTYYNNKTYRIDDVEFGITPESTFPMRDGTQISFIEYYRTKQNINIQVRSQPMLVSRSSQREIRAGMPETVLLVPELCKLTGLTDRQRENFQLMRAMADHTRIGPTKRMEKLNEFSMRMRRSPEALAEVRKWDLDLADRLVRFQGRVLPQETIVGGNNAKYPAGPQADWTRELRALPMFVAGQIPRFAVVCPVKLKGACQDFVQCLQKSARGMRWDIGAPRIFDINDDRSHSYLECIENLISKNNPSMIMCVVPNNSADRYSAIKKKCCVDRGVPTQVILAKNLTSKGVMSIATKVAIQLNCKVGGAPWTVMMPLTHLMIVGYDVCRDTVNKGKSFAAMVASMDKQMTRFFNSVAEHKMDEELSENFASFLLLACHKYKEIHGQFPDSYSTGF
ncbi:unnamed protein product [Phaedon cochleariae]|uniref:Uncharacterized protein n=1 Tax=Phaedon cochleariae TaxID=80249 RepID=A0A9N9S8K2_PHACE|nr:unnamed protein product [Phaedon cochleariae]